MAKPKTARLKTLGSRIAILDSRTAKPAQKVADSFYSTPEWRSLRAKVFQKRGRRCEKCGTTSGQMYADHIVELKDGGAPLDERGIQVLCASCHTTKTIAERAKRMSQVFI